MNENEIEIYRQFAGKVNCLAPILLDKSTNECVVMKRAITGVRFVHHSFINQRSPIRKKYRGQIRSILNNGIKNNNDIDIDRYYKNCLFEDLSRQFETAIYNGITAEKALTFCKDVVYIFNKTGVWVIDDAHTNNVGIYKQNYCVLDYADNDSCDLYHRNNY